VEPGAVWWQAGSGRRSRTESKHRMGGGWWWAGRVGIRLKWWWVAGMCGVMARFHHNGE